MALCLHAALSRASGASGARVKEQLLQPFVRLGRPFMQGHLVDLSVEGVGRQVQPQDDAKSAGSPLTSPPG